jgi:hypothetical protein
MAQMGAPKAGHRIQAASEPALPTPMQSVSLVQNWLLNVVLRQYPAFPVVVAQDPCWSKFVVHATFVPPQIGMSDPD